MRFAFGMEPVGQDDRDCVVLQRPDALYMCDAEMSIGNEVERLTMSEAALPILYSFRRCPYAMRARLALSVSETTCVHREIVLRDKAPAFLETSPKGTVPVLVLADGQVVEESFDIMMWALQQNDPERWLSPPSGSLDEMLSLIADTDDSFKTNLDRYKYPNRHGDTDPASARAAGSVFLRKLDDRLSASAFLFGDRPTLADMAILPFVRQFAHVDRDWFDSEDWSALRAWLDRFLQSDRFTSIMKKYPKWEAGDPVTLFPPDASSDASRLAS